MLHASDLDDFSYSQLVYLHAVLVREQQDELLNVIMYEMNRRNEAEAAILRGASKPRARVVNRIPMLTMREPLKKHGQDYYSDWHKGLAHASYHRGIRYTHEGLWQDCLECGPNAW